MRVFSNTQRPLAVFEAWIRSREYQRANGGPLVIVDEKGEVVCGKNGKPKPFHLVIVATGGGLSGVVSAGMFDVLQEEGYSDDPIGLVAVSAGLPNVLAFGCRKSHEVIPFYEHLVRQPFINLFRRGDPRMRLREDVILPMIRMLDHEKLRTYKPEIYVVLTEWESGKGRVVRLKVEDDPADWGWVTQAAMTIPNLSPPVELTNIIPKEPHRKLRFVDGASSKPLPLGEAMRATRPTHILVLAPRPLPTDLPLWESHFYWWLGQLGLWGVPSPTRKGTLSMDQETGKAIKRMQEIHPRVECTALFPKAGNALPTFFLSSFYTEWKVMMARKAGEGGKDLMRQCLYNAHLAVERHRGEMVF